MKIEGARPRAAAVPSPKIAVPNTNDSYLNAVVVTSNTLYTGNTSFATTDGSSACQGTNDVWFTFNPPATDTYSVSLAGTTFDSVLSVHGGSPPTSANQIDCDDTFGPEILHVSLDAGTTYYIRIAGYQGATGNYQLAVNTTEAIEMAVASNGNFTVGLASGSSGRAMLYDHPDPWSGATTLRVDGVDSWNFGLNLPQIGAKISGPALQPDGTNVTVWEFNGIRLTQRLGLIYGGTGTKRDTIKMEYTAQNVSSAGHLVGVRIMLDTYLGFNDGAPFRVPGLGNVSAEREVLAPNIPPYWTGFDSLTNPTKFSQGTLISSDSRPPDRVVWGAWPQMAEARWSYTVNQARSLLSDSAVYVYWNPTFLAPGESFTVSTRYGLSTVISDLTNPLALGVTAPTRLDLFNGLYSPNPFTVTAFIEHNLPGVTGTINNVRAQIVLPENLRTDDLAQINIGSIDRNASSLHQWRVVAKPNRAPANGGTATTDPVVVSYQVKLGADGYTTKTIPLSITLPLLGENSARQWAHYE